MKISIQQSILSRHLDNAAKFLPKKDTIPILSHIVLSSTPSGLEVIAGNTETFIKAIIPSEDYTAELDGAVAIPGKELTEIVKKLSGLVTFETESDQIIIRAGKSEFGLSSLDTEEYPIFPAVYGTSISMKAIDLKELIATTAYAVSTNESTPILTGIMFTQENGALKLISCDRHRLARIESENEGEEFQAVVYGPTMVELSKIIGDGGVELSFGNGMLVKCDEFTFYSRILDGTYPDPQKSIPTSFTTEFTINKHAFSAALDRILIVAKENKTHTVKLTIVQNEITVESKEQTKRARETVDINGFTGDEITIGVNGKYISETLKAIEATDIEVGFSGLEKPIIIHGKDELALHMVLPYRTI